MGMIEDITGFMRKGPQLLSSLDAVRMNTKSVARGAQDATFQFPNIVVNDIPIDTASTITRNLEKVYAAFTQSWLSMNPVIDISIDKTPLQYLKKFHQNVNFESVSNLEVAEKDLERCTELLESGAYELYTNDDKTFGVLFNVADAPTKAMLESHKRYLQPHLSGFDLRPFTEADSDMSNAGDVMQAMLDGRMRNKERDINNNNVRATEKFRAPQMTDGDIKKANDMMPYGIQVRLMAVNDRKEFVQYMDFIVGVKVVMHPISTDDMIDNIQRIFKNQSPLFKFLRWTTGEISLVKNLILNLDELKDEASRRQSGKIPFLDRLRRLKGKRIGVHNLTVPHAILPNSTFTISSNVADYVLDNIGIDLRDGRVGKKMVDNMFLMALVIVDDATGTLEILYDGQTQYQSYTLETLERETMMSSNKLGREIGRMISR